MHTGSLKSTPLQRGELGKNVNVGAVSGQNTELGKKAPWEFISTSLPSHRRDLKIHYLYAENPKGKINFKCFLVKITLGPWQMQIQNCSNPSGFPQSAKYDQTKNNQKHKNKPPGKDEQKKQRFRSQMTQMTKLSDRKYKISESRRGHMSTKTLVQ